MKKQGKLYKSTTLSNPVINVINITDNYALQAHNSKEKQLDCFIYKS